MGLNVNTLIAAASKKLGIPEDKLRKTVNDGNVEELRSYLSSADNAKIDRAMNDKGFTEELKNKYMAGR